MTTTPLPSVPILPYAGRGNSIGQLAAFDQDLTKALHRYLGRLAQTVNSIAVLSDGATQGPASAVDNNFASFDGTTGLLLQDSGKSAASFATAAQGILAASALQPGDIINYYQKTNILGTVSQSAGVPTGAVIESGSNANGEYVRYADGTQICFYSADLPAQAMSTSASVTCTFPAPFINGNYRITFSPSTPTSGSNYSNVGLVYYNGVYASVRLGGSHAFSSYAYRTATTIGTRFDLIAIGRWF